MLQVFHKLHLLLFLTFRYFQAIKEDISSLVFLQMEGPILRGLMDLYTEYTAILERSLTDKECAIENSGSKINLAESLVQQVSVIANLSTLVNIFSSIIRNVFKEISHLVFEMDSYILFIQEACSRLRANICEQFIHKIMSLEGDHRPTQNSFIWTQDDSDSSTNMMPSVPYQVRHSYEMLRYGVYLLKNLLVSAWGSQLF